MEVPPAWSHPGTEGQVSRKQCRRLEPPLWLLCYACSVPGFSWHLFVSLDGNLGVLPTARWEKTPMGSCFFTQVAQGMSGKERAAVFFSPRELNE